MHGENRFVRYYSLIPRPLFLWSLPVCKYGGEGLIMCSGIMCMVGKKRKKHEGQCCPNNSKFNTTLTLPWNLFSLQSLERYTKALKVLPRTLYPLCGFFCLPDTTSLTVYLQMANTDGGRRTAVSFLGCFYLQGLKYTTETFSPEINLCSLDSLGPAPFVCLFHGATLGHQVQEWHKMVAFGGSCVCP